MAFGTEKDRKGRSILMNRTSETTGARERVFRTRWAISTLVLALTIIQPVEKMLVLSSSIK